MRSARPAAIALPGMPLVASAILVALLAAFVYVGVSLVFAHGAGLFQTGRIDYYLLADAFLHGRTWLDQPPGSADVILIGGRTYVPFAPGPAFVVLPLVAAVGATVAGSWDPIVNALLGGVGVGLCWALSGRLGVGRTADRVWVVVLFGFSTAAWWVTVRGGVWHTAHLVASILTFLGLIEAFGRRRPLVLGALAGAAFITRAPLLFALPLWAWVVVPRPGDRGWEGGRRPSVLRPWALLVAGFVPAALFALWYNFVRFGSPLESGYGLALLNASLEAQRAKGLFSLAHLGMNLDYLLVRLPGLTATPPFIRPDGYGMSVLLTSPGLLLGLRADWRDRTPWALLATAALVLVPSLLYYGGGWFQYGYRYFLDSIPFVMALVALAAARVGVRPAWQAVITFGVIVNLLGVWWTYS